ncbi:hypothetical protein EN885_31515 [Mesorhizobium sp. M6A.T.Cr.TU.014.01.1.1]|nr:hypothetical protein EN885_31515 [Mesorhizobium sp. M6A.T.Cr.TU.014.01.1.1]RWP96044.1 MAG: hypothetical protein EOR90_30575 [Mesorhizobium sp.]RWP96987.1 MAG: hypothetical protein EOR91_30475 [Mesorhizobium sp.]
MTMRDGVKIALDVVLPVGGGANKHDVIFEMTPYWRSAEGRLPRNTELFVPHGFALVVGDQRGKGASFGRPPISVRARTPWTMANCSTGSSSSPGPRAEWSAMAVPVPATRRIGWRSAIIPG